MYRRTGATNGIYASTRPGRTVPADPFNGSPWCLCALPRSRSLASGALAARYLVYLPTCILRIFELLDRITEPPALQGLTIFKG